MRLSQGKLGRLDPVLSTYLDLARATAATVVLLGHFWNVLVPRRYPSPFPGHKAVLVFFVISGAVIAHSASKPGLSWSIYARHRVARIMSVAVPALLLAAAIIWITGSTGYGELPTPTGLYGVARNSAFNLVFLAHSWWIHAEAPINEPFWSLNYEVWYYIIFGAWLFGGTWAPLFVASAALLAGPKILLLMPAWIGGVWVCRSHQAWSRPIAACVFMLTALAMLGMSFFDLSRLTRNRLPLSFLGYSEQFPTDWVFAALVALHFRAVTPLAPYLRSLAAASNQIKTVAGYTFSAYLYHMPLFVLSRYVGILNWLSLVPVLLGIVLLAQISEKQAGRLRRALP